MIHSPITGNRGIKINELSCKLIASAYQRSFGIDVSKYLPAQEEICTYRCPDSDLGFFGPNVVAGPPSFYEELYSKPHSDWAYQSDKWEFRTARALIARNDQVLDVGCGSGSFLEMIRNDVKGATGLETSHHAIQGASSKGLTVFAESVFQHKINAANKYDALTLFQVLEHVDSPVEFLKGCIDVLRPGGTLIVSVPNNDFFIKDCSYLPLNLPPHHVTLWGRASLKYLPKILPLDLISIECEPLQTDNIGWYQSVMEERYIPKNWLIRRLYHRLGASNIVRKYLTEQHESISGHTILAAYRKHQ